MLQSYEMWRGIQGLNVCQRCMCFGKSLQEISTLQSQKKSIYNVQYIYIKISTFFLFQQLEDMVTNKIAESISARSTIGDLRRKCDKHEEDVEKWKRKTQMLQSYRLWWGDSKLNACQMFVFFRKSLQENLTRLSSK